MINITRKISIITLWVIFISQSINLHAQERSNRTVLSTEELQWMLGVSNSVWGSELKLLARLLEDKDYAQADEHADAWLENNFEQAMASLPAMRQFFTYFTEHSVAPVFALHLGQYEWQKQMEVLAILDLNNLAVRRVGFRVMENWWFQDQAGMIAWIQQTPSFFEDLYFEEFLKNVQPQEKDPSTLALCFLSLDNKDARRLRFFGQIIEGWISRDIDSALLFINTLYDASEVNPDRALDRAAITLSYRFAYEKNYDEALNWAFKIRDAEMRESSVRDHSLSVTQQAEKDIFLKWLKLNTLYLEEYSQEVDAQLSAVAATELQAQ